MACDMAVVTLLPEMFTAITEHGISGRAIDNGLATLSCFNPRDYCSDNYRQVDDKPYGGGAGMVLMAPPLIATIAAAKKQLPQAKVVAVTPQGKPLNQDLVKQYAKAKQVIFVAGRYEGIDERVLQQQVDEEVSLGDYIISGGELAVMVIVDAIIRLLPGALGHVNSKEQDSFAKGLLAHPQYTRPAQFAGVTVPQVLLSGDHVAIEKWRLQQALGRTWQRRPDLLEQVKLTATEQQLLQQFIDSVNE